MVILPGDIGWQVTGDPPAGCKRHSLRHLALTGARLDRFPVPSEPAGGFAPKLKYTPECVIC
jgi:hypothetical protein